MDVCGVRGFRRTIAILVDEVDVISVEWRSDEGSWVLHSEHGPPRRNDLALKLRRMCSTDDVAHDAFRLFLLKLSRFDEDKAEPRREIQIGECANVRGEVWVAYKLLRGQAVLCSEETYVRDRSAV